MTGVLPEVLQPCDSLLTLLTGAAFAHTRGPEYTEFGNGARIYFHIYFPADLMAGAHARSSQNPARSLHVEDKVTYHERGGMQNTVIAASDFRRLLVDTPGKSDSGSDSEVED
ncbi:hypothetical protein B0H19DRAFT_1380207 [Mycena capillaripes]|nr:hypothetical protein B0H19DRAFT_1380207 [Mycena capillaripes]